MAKAYVANMVEDIELIHQPIVEGVWDDGGHGFTEADAVDAMSNSRYYEPELDESRR